MSDFRHELVDAGVLIATGVDGVVGRGAVFEDVLMRLDAVISRWGQGNGAEMVYFPPVMNSSYLETNGYLKSFPQLATALHGFTCDDHGQVTGEDLPTELMLVPAACYPIYPMVAERGPLPAGGGLFDICSWCFRREPSKDAARLQSFRMHEYVRLGTEEDVLAFRDGWIVEARGLSIHCSCRSDWSRQRCILRPRRPPDGEQPAGAKLEDRVADPCHQRNRTDCLLQFQLRRGPFQRSLADRFARRLQGVQRLYRLWHGADDAGAVPAPWD